MTTLLVSVVIAVKNSAAYLADCLDSVTAQTFKDVEILVVDGHSTDATEVDRSLLCERAFLPAEWQGVRRCVELRA